MDLRKLHRQIAELEIELVELPYYDEPGRLLEVRGQAFLFLNQTLSDVEKANVIYHELSHYKNKDTDNALSQVPTYAPRLEHLSESERIIDFMSFINEEYPIDETFDYLAYMDNAYVPSRYEHLVKETARRLYEENIRAKRI